MKRKKLCVRAACALLAVAMIGMFASTAEATGGYAVQQFRAQAQVADVYLQVEPLQQKVIVRQQLRQPLRQQVIVQDYRPSVRQRVVIRQPVRQQVVVQRLRQPIRQRVVVRRPRLRVLGPRVSVAVGY